MVDWGKRMMLFVTSSDMTEEDFWKWSGRLLLGDNQSSSSGRFPRCDTPTGGNVSSCSVSLLSTKLNLWNQVCSLPELVPSNLLLHSSSFQRLILLPPWRCASTLTPPSCFHAFTADLQARAHSCSRSLCLNMGGLDADGEVRLWSEESQWGRWLY